MLVETGRVVSADSDALWVETIQKSSCDVCSAQKGCGQRLLSQLTGKTTRIRIPLNGVSSARFSVGQEIAIGIPEHLVVSSSLLVYLVPILGALAGAWCVDSPVDAYNMLGAVGGLLLGGLLVRLHSLRNRNNSDVNPVLVDEALRDLTSSQSA